MTRTSSLFHAALSASFAAYFSAAETDAEAAAVLARHGMSIDSIASIYTSEVGDDFGEPLILEQSNELWAINTEWQFQENMKAKLSALGVPNNYASYLGCYNETGKSGNERKEILKAMFQNYTDRIYVSDNSIVNYDDRSCFSLSADLGVFWDVLQNNPTEVTQFFELQPAGPSMKMLEGFYKALDDRLMKEGDILVPSDNGSIVITEDEEMALGVVFCPVINAVISAAPEEDKYDTYNDLLIDVMDFISEKDGKYVKGRDFFYHAYSTDLTPGLVSDRMKTWHDVVANVTSFTNATGYNKCFDGLIKGQMVTEKISDGSAQVTFPVLEEVGNEDEQCIFYLVRALANHPYVCRMDLIARVEPLPGTGGTGTGAKTGAPASSATWVQGGGVASAIVPVAAGLALTTLL